VSVECRLLRRNYREWTIIGRSTSNGPVGKHLIPEDAVFADDGSFARIGENRRDGVRPPRRAGGAN
jgi:hypothetical protein